MSKKTRADFDGEHFQYLFELQQSGVTNMFGAGSFVMRAFDLKKEEASEVVSYWMAHYSTLKEELLG